MSSLSLLIGKDANILHEKNFQILLIANTVGPLGIAILSPVLDSLTGPFGVSPSNIGLMMSAFTAPAVITIPLAGMLSDRFGRKPILVGGLLILGIAGTAIAFTTSFRIALILRLIQGIGSAAIVPLVITSIGDIYGDATEATAQGLRFTGSGLTHTVSPLIAGVLVGIAWQYPFLLYAIGLPIAVIVFFWFEEPKVLTKRETEGKSQGKHDKSPVKGIFPLLRKRRVQAMIVARALIGVIWIGFLTYNSIIVVQFMGRSPTHAGILAAVASLSLAIAATQTGRITRVFPSRLNLLIIANIVFGIGFLLMLFTDSFSFAVLSIAIAGCGFGLTLSIYRSIITNLAPGSLRGSLVSLAEAFGRLVTTLTPIVMGVLISATIPIFGLQTSIRIVGVGIAVASIGGGVTCLLIASNSPPVQT